MTTSPRMPATSPTSCTRASTYTEESEKTEETEESEKTVKTEESKKTKETDDSEKTEETEESEDSHYIPDYYYSDESGYDSDMFKRCWENDF